MKIPTIDIAPFLDGIDRSAISAGAHIAMKIAASHEGGKG